MSGAAVGVDIGSGAARALALDRDGAILGAAVEHYAGAATWPVGRASAEAWRVACLAALERLAAEVPAARRPAAVAVGGQSPVTVAAGGGMAVTMRHPAGNDGDNAVRQQAQRAVLDAERAEPCAPRQLWDWLLATLGAADAQGRWPGDPELEGFGSLRRTGEVVGTARGEGSLPAGTPLVTGAQDAYLACWAGGIDVVGRALDPGGRTGGLAVAVEESMAAEGLWTFPSAARGVAIAGGPVNAHGIAVEWVSRLLGRPLDELLALAATVPAGAGGVMVLPFLEGERAPRWDARLRGTILGLQTGTGPGELTRAVLEGAALGLAHIAAGLRAAGARIDVVVCAGRPALSDLWCGIKAAALGVDALVPEDPDLAAYGAALAAGAGAGWWPRPGEGAGGDWPQPAMRRVPAAEGGDVYRRLLERFVAAGDAVQNLPAIFGSNRENVNPSTGAST